MQQITQMCQLKTFKKRHLFSNVLLLVSFARSGELHPFRTLFQSNFIFMAPFKLTDALQSATKDVF